MESSIIRDSYRDTEEGVRLPLRSKGLPRDFIQEYIQPASSTIVTSCFPTNTDRIKINYSTASLLFTVGNICRLHQCELIFMTNEEERRKKREKKETVMRATLDYLWLCKVIKFLMVPKISQSLRPIQHLNIWAIGYTKRIKICGWIDQRFGPASSNKYSVSGAKYLHVTRCTNKLIFIRTSLPASLLLFQLYFSIGVWLEFR